MSHTDYFQWTTGDDLYAKPLPLVDGGSWDADIISGVENGSLGSYAFASLDDNTDYNVYVAAGGAGSEANADLAVGLLDASKTLTVARSEPGQTAPPVNPDLATKIDYLYKAWRNKKTQTATTFSLFADDGTTVDQQATVSDDGTTGTVGEMASGS